jgi:hypothetical protein
MEWIEISLPRTSADLFARLPFEDAVKLAVLAGTGQMTWPEINAALNAKIKLATADALNKHGEKFGAPNAYDEWEEAKRKEEDEIWARYHAKCDEVFADDTAPLDASSCSLEQLLGRERILNRLRGERDRALAALDRQLDAGCPQPIRLAIRLKPSQVAMLKTRLTPAESAAICKLDATGFADSEGLETAVSGLVGEITGDIVAWQEREQQASRA